MLRRHAPHTAVLTALFAWVVASPSTGAASSFTLFETGQVRPLALSPSGAKLFAVNTPDARLEIFEVTPAGLVAVGAVATGLEPTAVAARSDTEVWVVNHLSDSVSIVDVSDPRAARVVRTLLVGDEPRDLVFAGPGRTRAFVTTAHRGQNTPFQDDIAAVLTTPSLGRADVWVFDATALGSTPGGVPETILTFFGDTPRGLAVTPDGSRVYAAVFMSGNRTTTIGEPLVPDGGAEATGPSDCSAAPGGLPPPNRSFDDQPQPEVGLIVQHDGTHWRDELGRCWDSEVRFSLPDRDVFAIDATTDPPTPVAGPLGSFAGVGTTLFNLAVNPVSGVVYVSNLEAFNRVRFEGNGLWAAAFKPFGEPASVRGHLVESRITLLDGGTVLPRHLNKHVDYGTCCTPLPNAENDTSLAFPLEMAVSNDGRTLYVAGFGSSEVGVYDTDELAADTFVPSTADQIPVSGGGPTGLVLDETRGRLYVLTRFDNGISVVATATGTEIAHVRLFNPEPASVVDGRRFLYDAASTSSHGDSACASCHVFGDLDHLAWDLGDPGGDIVTNYGPFALGPFISPDFRPMKGPMTTQSLRGMANHGPMHWRGDRHDARSVAGRSSQPDTGAFDEAAAFGKFNPAFEGLIGRDVRLTDAEMERFTDFILQVTYPPNPIRALDNSLTPDQAAGRTFFFERQTDILDTCNGCHVLDPRGNAASGVAAPGFFGTDGRYSFDDDLQIFKIPHLRNLYQKVGKFGLPQVPQINPGNNEFMGEQIRGFGYLHDGAVDTLFRFHNGKVFNAPMATISTFGTPEHPFLLANDGFLEGAEGDPERRQMEQFMLAFDSNLAPIVGQQITDDGSADAALAARLALLQARANTGECDLIATGRRGGRVTGYLHTGGGTFTSDRAGDEALDAATLRVIAAFPGQALTHTCVPPGAGRRSALDRDDDGFGDGDELDAGSDPANATSTAPASPLLCHTVTQIAFRRANVSDARGALSLRAVVPLAAYASEPISVLARDGGGTIVAANLPGATLALRGRSYRFRSRAPGFAQVKIAPAKPNGLEVSVDMRRAWTAPRADESAASTLIELNVGGHCFRGSATRL